MIPARSNCCPCLPSPDPPRRALVNRCTIAQLPITVIPPCPQTAVRLERYSVLETCRNSRPGIICPNLDRGGLINRGSVSELTIIIIPPSPPRPVPFKRH